MGFNKASSASSQRTRVAAAICLRHVNVAEEDAKFLGSWRDQHKEKNLDSFRTHPQGMAVPEELLESHNGRFYGFPPEVPALYDDVGNGFVHWLDKEKGVFSCAVVPKNQVRAAVSPRSSDEFVAGLERLQETEPACVRGDSKGISDGKYTSHGIKILQGRGFSKSKIYEKDPEAANKLDKHCKRLEHLACHVIPSKWLRGVKEAAEVCTLKTFDGCVFGAGLASAINYRAPAHVDKDFFVSIHQLNVEGHCGSNEIAQHFVFPTCGCAVALRPGDVLVFNPHVHHCLSSVSPFYAKLRVHVSTLHVKTAHMSKNDKTAELTPEETEAQELLGEEDLCPISFKKQLIKLAI